MAIKKLPSDSPITRIKEVLGESANNGTAALAKALKKGDPEPQAASVMETMIDMSSSLEALRLFPGYLESRSMTPETRKQYEELSKQLAGLLDQDMLSAMKDPELKPLFAAMFSAFDAQVKPALDAQLKPEMPKIIADAIKQTTESFRARDWTAAAKCLANDVGVAGRLDEREISVLANWLKKQADTTIDNMRTIAGYAGEIEPTRFLSAVGSELKTSLSRLQQLKTEFANA
jgi:hypothetical protein